MRPPDENFVVEKSGRGVDRKLHLSHTQRSSRRVGIRIGERGFDSLGNWCLVVKQRKLGAISHGQ